MNRKTADGGDTFALRHDERPAPFTSIYAFCHWSVRPSVTVTSRKCKLIPIMASFAGRKDE